MTTAAGRAAAAAVLAAGLLVLVGRPLLPGGTAAAIVCFAGLFIVGAAWPTARDHPPARTTSVAALAAGVGVFAVARLVAGHAPVPHRLSYVGAVLFAAVAEELFFRRFAYAALRPGGVAWAIGGSSLLFGLAHVTVYGWWVLPLDIAAGLVLGWQRWATGSWAAPAATHALANLLIVL